MAQISEAQTRQQLIDQQLQRAGWSTLRRKVVEELALPRSVLQTRERCNSKDAAHQILQQVGEPSRNKLKFKTHGFEGT